MPHYKDGTEAQLGDVVRDVSEYGAARKAGEVLSIQPGSTTCNANVAFIEDAASEKSSFSYGQVFVHRAYGNKGYLPPQFRALNICTVTLSDMELVYREAGPNEQGPALTGSLEIASQVDPDAQAA